MKSAPAPGSSPSPAASRRGPGAIRRHPVLFAAALLALLLAVVLAWALWWVRAQIPLTPDVADITRIQAERPTVVLSSDGKELAVLRRTYREWVKLADISPHVIEALLATEDRRFHEHRGVDVKRTASALLSNLRGEREGGSTLTQQLARNLYPEEIGRAPTLTRKVKEAITALKIERIHSKQEILETYLNTVPFLYNAYGIEMAARTYFDKPARKLDVLESATLIGMLKGTSYYNPVLNPERSRQRRNTVLSQMARHNVLAQAEFESLKQQPLRLDFERQVDLPGEAPHFTQQLRRWLIDWGDRNGYDILSDGLVVHTTLDSRLQQMAVDAVTRQADKLQAIADKAWKPAAHKALVVAFLRETPQYKTARDAGETDDHALRKLQSDAALMQSLWQEKTRLQAGFMAMDPANGHVKAWVGSRDFRQDQFDHVEQARRQPGSTFKPFVYGAAIEQGIGPGEVFFDEAVEIRLADGNVWRPGDIDAPSGNPMTLRDGLVQSKNTITAQVMQRVGSERVAKVAHDMGVRQSKIDSVPSLALGTSPVTLKEMVAAYGAIANNGGYIEPVLVTRIENHEKRVLAQFQPPAPEQGLSRASAQTLLDMMRGVIDQGTGAAIRSRFGIRGDVAGKTGTTQDYTDGWFILMHPNLVGGAWVGFNDNRVTMRNSWGQGGRNALHIVGDFFQQSLKAKAIDAKARFAAPRLPAPVIDPMILGRGNDWQNGFSPNGTPEAPAPAAVVVVPPAFSVAPPPATRPDANIPAPAVIGRSHPPTDSMSGPPAQRSPEFQWIPERPPDAGDASVPQITSDE
jgi:penicillin-binding protein 1A